MKRLLTVLFLLTILFLPFKVKAAWYCDYIELAELKDIATNIKYVYDYRIENDKAIFKITLTNIYKEFYVYDVKNDKYYYPDSNKDISEITIDGYQSGISYNFIVYTTRAKCEEKVIYSFYVTLPTYNKYYNDLLCKDYQDYKLCQKWANLGNLSYDDFKKQMNEYIESLKPKEESKEEEGKVLYWLLEFYLKYYMYILPVIIISALIAIYSLNKKDRVGF